MGKVNTKKIMTSKDVSNTPQMISEKRQKMISDTAYYIAEKRNFDGERELDDWLEAERIINQSIE